MIASSILLAIAIVAPKDGATVPTQRDGQKAYLEEKRTERYVRMDNPADRAKLLAIGSTQKPLKLNGPARRTPSTDWPFRRRAGGRTCLC